VFPDAAITTGAITNKKVIAVARWLERVSYHRSDAVVVLSEDLQKNVVAKIAPRHQSKVHVIPNFVDAERIVPMGRMTNYRSELGIASETVVMYAGNVGFSQSLTMIIDAAKAMKDVAFVINGDGAARAELVRAAQDVPNVYFSDYQPRERVPEVLASGDIHVVLLKAGLGAVSVPSKTYSILAAARPVVAAIDSDTEVTRILATSGAGTVVAPDNSQLFISALQAMCGDLDASRQMGQAGRQWVQSHVSPAVVARSYLDLCNSLSR
jgi:colanic acid biosynthesis glycosyl transferase WcaI